MNTRILAFAGTLLLCHISFFPDSAHAVIPPDFIFNIGTQLAQILSLVAILATAAFGAFFQFFRSTIRSLTAKRVFINLGVIAIFGACFASAYFYAGYKQQSEYDVWIAESEKYNAEQEVLRTQLLASGVNEDANDQLNIGSIGNESVDMSSAKFVFLAEARDQSARFIKDYYEYVANGKFEDAYRMSPKAVDLAAFKDIYRKTTKITLDKLQRIDDHISSVELTIFEGPRFERYGTLITLAMQGSLPLRIEKSEAKILVSGSVENQNVAVNEAADAGEYGFFSENESRDILMTNGEFAEAIKNTDEFIILDAREDIEFENGHYPGSMHIRYADLKAGRWIELPKDTYIYVLCWSGIRGKEVAEFLRSKKFVASYLENGASGWVDYGGTWQGGIRLAEEYDDERYTAVLETADVKARVQSGVVLVDSREPYKFDQWHIPGSHSIPILYTPSFELEDAFSQIPQKSTVITVCDGYVNCFDAKVTGVELERRGHTFLGRYIKPWEYERN